MSRYVSVIISIEGVEKLLKLQLYLLLKEQLTDLVFILGFFLR